MACRNSLPLFVIPAEAADFKLTQGGICTGAGLRSMSSTVALSLPRYGANSPLGLKRFSRLTLRRQRPSVSDIIRASRFQLRIV